ncbi:MAG: hypothetical protein ACK5IB_05805 [Qingshengfaniella sp.]
MNTPRLTAAQAMLKWSADQGTVLSCHHPMGAMIQNAEDIDGSMEGATKDLTLLHDTGHLPCAGARPDPGAWPQGAIPCRAIPKGVLPSRRLPTGWPRWIMTASIVVEAAQDPAKVPPFA